MTITTTFITINFFYKSAMQTKTQFARNFRKLKHIRHQVAWAENNVLLTEVHRLQHGVGLAPHLHSISQYHTWPSTFPCCQMTHHPRLQILMTVQYCLPAHDQRHSSTILTSAQKLTTHSASSRHKTKKWINKSIIKHVAFSHLLLKSDNACNNNKKIKINNNNNNNNFGHKKIKNKNNNNKNNTFCYMSALCWTTVQSNRLSSIFYILLFPTHVLRGSKNNNDHNSSK